MKKLLSLFCAIFMTTVIFAGCSSSKNEKKEEATVRTITTVKGILKFLLILSVLLLIGTLERLLL